MRPNPFMVPRQPQAKVRGRIFSGSKQSSKSDYTQDYVGLSDLFSRIEVADLVSEGAVYDAEVPARFFGSAVLTLSRPPKTVGDDDARPLQLLNDPRIRRFLESRLYRELVRHLDVDAPSHFDWQGQETLESGEHRVYMDFECVLAGSAEVGA